MNFSQLHEELRLELLRRMERGVLTGTLLARQSGLRPAHISNFLHGKRNLSQSALDRVLAAQSLTVESLLPAAAERHARLKKAAPYPQIKLPLISQSTAMYEAQIRPSSILELIHLPQGYLDHLRTRRSPDRRDWERFVAVRTTFAQVEAMMPVLAPHAILVIDRHYNSFTQHHARMPNIYAVRCGSLMVFRYAAFQGNCVVLRPYKIEEPLEIVELKAAESPTAMVIGRICASISEV